MNNPVANIIQNSSNIIKSAAIYCRVSTESQEREGTSLETQRASCLKYCQEHGYTVTNQFIETFSGLTIERPELEKLRQAIRNREINTLVIHCLDRLSRDPVDGALLIQEMERYGVKLEAVNESIENDDTGKMITYIRQYAAKLEAKQIHERSTRGIKARVINKGKPPTYRRAPYGYDWDKENNALIPNDSFDTARFIIESSLSGKSYDWIINELKKRGVNSPTGLDSWNKHTIESIIHNPVYMGKFYAFKSVASKPNRKDSKSLRAKSSSRRLPQSQWLYMPNVKVEKTIITEQQRTLMLDQLEKRQKLSSRNATREYLLRGMVLCMTHKGQGGEPRTYHGRPSSHNDGWFYVCPVGGCDSANIDGEVLEHVIFNDVIGYLLNMKPESFYSNLTGRDKAEAQQKELEAEKVKIDLRLEQILNNMAKIEGERIEGKLETPVYERLNLKYRAERERLNNRADQIKEQMQITKCEQLAIESWRDIKRQYLQRLNYQPETMLEELLAGYKADGPRSMLVPTGKPGEMRLVRIRQAEPKADTKPLSFEEKRELLSKLNIKIEIYPDDTEHGNNEMAYKIDVDRIKTDLAIKRDPKMLAKLAPKLRGRKHKTVNFVVRMALPINPEAISNIALHAHDNILRNQKYFPIQISNMFNNKRRGEVSVMK